MQRTFSRLAIVNRGEPAMRLIHAVHELNQDRKNPITVIALFTEGDRDAMFVRRADEAVCLGPSLVDDGLGGWRSGYLNYGALESALRTADAEAAWVGWGFVAEQPEFVELCELLGIVFVGPDAPTMRLLGDKIAAKRLAEEAGVPVAAWSRGPVATAEEALEHAQRIGLPLMVKAAAGGGGRGIRRVDEFDALPAAFASARAEALQAFGDGTLLLEQVITPARHIEVQIIADGHGKAWPVGVRDCSYQRRNQKVIEESSSPALTADQERELMAAAQRLVLRVGYRSAGTVEFLYEPAERRFSFMEVNTRLQVEHPVTEAVTGLDLVKLQLHIAAGGRLEGEPPPSIGHAIEARLNAEDPALGFAPAPGRLTLLRLPTGPGVRVDTGVAEGDVIPAEFDSMIGKLIAWGSDRKEALARLRRAVADTVAVVEGGTTNQGFLLELLNRPEVLSGEVDTSWLDRLYLSGEAVPVRHGDIAVLQAAIELHAADTAADQARFYAFARRGRPQAAPDLSRKYELRHRGQSYRCVVAQIGPNRYSVTVGEQAIELSVNRLGKHQRRLHLRGQAYRTLTSRQGDDLLVEVDGVPHRISRGDAGTVRNLSPAVVVSIPVAVGDEVEAGDVVALVEAMKMESSLTAPFAGRVKEVFVSENTHVAAQAPLLALEPRDQDAPEAATGERLAFLPAPGQTRPTGRERQQNLIRLQWLLLGYDIDRADAERTIAELRSKSAVDAGGDPALIAVEHRLLGLFADLRAVSRSRRDEPKGEPGLLQRQSPQELFHAWLRSLDAPAEGLPARFVAQLRRALAHYGIESLERTPALEEACHRLYLSGQRTDTARAAILAILDRRLEEAGEAARVAGGAPGAEGSAEFRDVLDRLVLALEGGDPIVADLAREVRFRYFDEPVIAASRERVYFEMAGHIAALTGDPERSDRAELIAAIVDCPRPLAPRLTSAMAGASAQARRLLVEAMARRYYRVRSLEEFEPIQLDGHEAVLARYTFEGSQRHLVAACAKFDDLRAIADAFSRWAAELPDGELAVLDLYAEHRSPAPSREALARRLGDALGSLALPPALHRIVVAVAEPRRGQGMSAVDLLTFRPGLDGLVESEIERGLHPLMGHRLQLWRLREFELERLPSSEDIYVFHGVARTNPKDERLFALAEIRDLTPVRDDQGRVAALPELEQMLLQALETIRAYQARRPLSRRLLWNRALLHVWPVIELAPEVIRELVARLVPLTAGLGLEMVLVQGRLRESDGVARDRVLRLFAPTGHDVAIQIDDPPTLPLQPLDEGAQRLISARRRGTLHPAEVVRLLAPAQASAGQPAGTFVEHDLSEDLRLVPVQRPAATNTSGIVVGTVRNFTDRYPEGMLRVILLGDPTRALGSLSEPECRRIMAAIDLAEQLGVPLEWFALSAGAKIAMDSGTEAMDWIAAVLRRIVLFTQAGGELNVIVAGINVGAQPYWNAEATMLMHTRGALIMTPDSAMVLTGKQAIDYSGGVSAEDNFGIGGYERIMGPNGQGQYWASDLAGACRVLLEYYEHSYVAPGERFPRRAVTSDPSDRDVGESEHVAPGTNLPRVADIFSDQTNPERKQPFDIRSVMRAAIDRDHPPLERWAAMHAAENAVVWDAHLGGWPVGLIGIESRPLPRPGEIPADGPDQWTSGTLFPRSAKKIARAINAVAGRRPVVVLANLAGFDASPESMRQWQLEFGAEIGRAVVNFDGPIVFCVVSRYHGGAFVVFSQKLNPNLETVALEGAHASVIGGAPAAAVVFAREVEREAGADERITALDRQLVTAEGAARQRLRAERAALWAEVLAQKRGQFAERFDQVHSVERAVEVGSVRSIINAQTLRPFLIEAVQRGMENVLDRVSPATVTDGASGTESNGHGLAQPTPR
jgi:acetyl/propionyl-CoA carboxylase alpha subunit/acetyl-CoA carboxylase carboxyltransferase component